MSTTGGWGSGSWGESVWGRSVYDITVLESAAAADSEYIQGAYNAPQQETVNATTAVDCTLNLTLVDVEQLNAIVGVSCTLTQHVDMIETSIAIDNLIAAGSTFNVVMFEELTALDNAYLRALWEIIDNEQNPYLVNIDNEQNPYWVNINNTQIPNWTPVIT